MSEAFTDEDYERVVRERDEALARIDSQRSQIAFYRTACTARFLPEGFGDETIRELINDLMEDRDDARSTIEDLNDEIARGREAIRIYRTETEAAKRERDEARATIEQIRRVFGNALAFDDARGDVVKMAEIAYRGACEGDKAIGQLRDMTRQRDEARAEVERLRAEVERAIIDRDHAEVRARAYLIDDRDDFLRGAEAMREAAMSYARKIGFYALAADIRCLPIPEET